MRNGCRAHRVGWLLVLALIVVARQARAQLDVAGQWGLLGSEDVRAKGAEGAHIGDYTGIPLNEAGRVRAESWDASGISLPERQAEPHPTQYFTQATRIGYIIDPQSRRLIGYTICCLFGDAERVVWVDGRPHPPEYAQHTWQGFSTGEWHGNVFTITTTHMKTGYILRNGTPASSKAVVTEHLIRHGDRMVYIQIVDDPAYLSEPMIRSTDMGLTLGPPGAGLPYRMAIADEITGLPEGYVPSYALGTKHQDWAAYVGLPWEASRGGAETLYPEYLPTLRKLVSDHQAATNAQKNSR